MAGVGSPVHVDWEGKRTRYLGLIFSQSSRWMQCYSISIIYLVLWPLVIRLEAFECLVQVGWLIGFFVCSLQFMWEGFWSILLVLAKGLYVFKWEIPVLVVQCTQIKIVNLELNQKYQDITLFYIFLFCAWLWNVVLDMDYIIIVP